MAAVGRGFVVVARFFSDLANANRCVHELQRLSRLSDAEVARRGLKRDEIVAYAFRHQMYE